MYRAQAAAKEAKTEYEVVTRRVVSEFEMFRSQKVVDMRDIMLAFVNIQVRHWEREKERRRRREERRRCREKLITNNIKNIKSKERRSQSSCQENN